MKLIMRVILAIALLAGCITIAMCLNKPDQPVSHMSDTLGVIDRSITTLISDDISDIGEYAFTFCKELTYVDLSGSPQIMIGQEAFAECYALETAIFPTLTVVDNRAFSGCEKLSCVVFYDISSGEAYVGDDVFICTPVEQGNGFIYVPDRCVELAKNLFWQYEDRVLSIEN